MNKRLVLAGVLLWLPLSALKAAGSEYPCRFMSEGMPEAMAYETMRYSAHPSADGQILRVEGPIEQGESERLDAAIRETIRLGPIAEVWLNSGGGAAGEGMDMGRVLRKHGVPTRIAKGSVCFSACSYAFLGGPLRNVDHGGEYGVHMFTASPYLTGQVVDGLKKDAPKVKSNGLKNTENVVKDIEQDSAQFAATFLHYLSEMGVSAKVGSLNFATANKSGSCPPPNVLREWNIVNGF
ncbi:MAG: hypothetical protein PHU14_10610 [Methylovulum sp.]|nr:hypothetical protein [Methylovulum sp.]